MDDDLDNIQWIDSKKANVPMIKPKTQPKADKEVSKIVGKTVLINDPRLIRLVAKWKNELGEVGEYDTVNFLKDPNKIKELKETFV